MTQNKQYIEQHKSFGRVRAVPCLSGLYPGVCLITEEKARENLSQGSRRVPAATMNIRKHTIRNTETVLFYISKVVIHCWWLTGSWVRTTDLIPVTVLYTNWVVFFMHNLQLQVVKQNSLYNCYISVTVKCVLHGTWIETETCLYWEMSPLISIL